jgi:hypothetical protein
MKKDSEVREQRRGEGERHCHTDRKRSSSELSREWDIQQYIHVGNVREHAFGPHHTIHTVNTERGRKFGERE